jgi:hypothetical protein
VLLSVKSRNGVKRALDARAVEAEPKTVPGGCWHRQAGYFDPFLGGENVNLAVTEFFKVYIG